MHVFSPSPNITTTRRIEALYRTISLYSAVTKGSTRTLDSIIRHLVSSKGSDTSSIHCSSVSRPRKLFRTCVRFRSHYKTTRPKSSYPPEVQSPDGPRKARYCCSGADSIAILHGSTDDPPVLAVFPSISKPGPTGLTAEVGGSGTPCLRDISVASYGESSATWVHCCSLDW